MYKLILTNSNNDDFVAVSLWEDAFTKKPTMFINDEHGGVIVDATNDNFLTWLEVTSFINSLKSQMEKK